jgi:rhodanese-related sulfurtransferase
MSFLSSHAATPTPPTTPWAPITRAMGAPEVTVSWAAGSGRLHRLVDVRSPGEFSGPMGHAQGAELVPLDTLQRSATGWDRDEAIVLICLSGSRSLAAAGLLEAMGFSRVVSVTGGMLQWHAHGLPIER